MLKPLIPKLFADAIPAPPIRSVVEWAERYVKLPGSARSESYDASITPWTREPVEWSDDGITRILDFCKPVQAGGSAAGEVALCRWLATSASGDVQYNWEDDDKAGDRWNKRIERILKACAPLMERAPTERHKWTKGLVMFPHCNLTVQGAFTSSNLDSDSIRLQINEELHNWQPGHLQKAFNRTTAFWNSVIFNISNASTKGDQFHQSWDTGTRQLWEVPCPGCGQFHVMRTRWEDSKPELGGLRYDSEKARNEHGGYNYARLMSTIRYQFPCGHTIPDDVVIRRALSLGGRYSAPTNPDAPLSHRSMTLDAVAVDYIPWITLIEEKHKALRAMKYGDPEPFRRYVTERECRFWDPEERPVVGKVVVNDALKKDRDGLRANPAFFARIFALDYQQGSLIKGEFQHWWLVIRDFLSTGDSLLVFEGKVETDNNVIEILDRHGCVRRHGAADSGHDAEHVYRFCLRHGINAIKGGQQPFYSHGTDRSGNQIKRIWSDERKDFLHHRLNAPPSQPDRADEPRFWLYSKHGIRERLHWLRTGGALKWEVPGDVSEDYKKHMEAEELVTKTLPSTGERVTDWVQRAERNDLFVCECYCALQAEMAGIIGMEAGK